MLRSGGVDELARTLVTLGLLLLVGLATDAIGRRTALPRVTLLLAFGLGIGPSGLDLMGDNHERWFPLLAHVALGVVGFLLGDSLSAENLRKQGASIPGIRPGKRTAEYLTQKTRRITLVGALFLGFVAILPWLVDLLFGFFTGAGTGTTGTSIMLISSTGLLITVGVILDTMRQLEAQLQMRHYDKFLRRGILG